MTYSAPTISSSHLGVAQLASNLIAADSKSPTRSTKSSRHHPNRSPQRLDIHGASVSPRKIHHAVIITVEEALPSHDTPSCRCTTRRAR
jgi:hypothetical protein